MSQVVARRPVGPGVVGQVEDGQDRPEALGQFRLTRDPIRDVGGLDLVLGPDESLGHRRFGDQEGPGHLGRGQATEQPQRQGDLRLGRERRVAAREDQAESVVLHGPGLLSCRLVRELDHLPEEFATARLAAEVIDGSISGGRRDPATGVRRQAVGGPLPQGEGERLLDRVLGEIDVAEDPDQGGHRPTGLLAEDPADQRVIDDGQDQPPAVSTNGQTSIGDEISLVTFVAQPSAASRSAASMM